MTKEWKRGEKREVAIKIMAALSPGHSFEDAAKNIATEIEVPDGSARSYYRYIVDNKLIPNFVASTPEKKAKKEKPESTDNVAPSTGNPANIDKIKTAAGKLKKKASSKVTPVIDAMAAAGLHHASTDNTEAKVAA